MAGKNIEDKVFNEVLDFIKGKATKFNVPLALLSKLYDFLDNGLKVKENADKDIESIKKLISKNPNRSSDSASKIVEDLMSKNAETEYSYDQMSRIFKALYPAMEKQNMSFSDMTEYVKKVSFVMSNADVNMKKVKDTNFSKLLNGNVSKGSELYKVIEKLDLTNKDYKQSFNKQLKDISLNHYDLSVINGRKNSIYETGGHKIASIDYENLKLAMDFINKVKEESSDIRGLSDVKLKFSKYLNQDNIKKNNKSELEEIEEKLKVLKDEKDILVKNSTLGGINTNQGFTDNLTRNIKKLEERKKELTKTDKEYYEQQLKATQEESKKLDQALKYAQSQGLKENEVKIQKKLNPLLEKEKDLKVQIANASGKKYFDLKPKVVETTTNSTNLNEVEKVKTRSIKPLVSTSEISTRQKKPLKSKKLKDAKKVKVSSINKEIEKANKKLKPLTLKFKGFDEVSNSIATIGNNFNDLNKAAYEYDLIRNDSSKSEKEKKQASIDYASTTIQGYGEMAGAMAGFYSADSAERKKLMQIQKAMSIANMAMMMAELNIKGTLAVLTQGSGDPYSAFGRMAAMAAIVASLGVMISGGGTSSHKNTYETVQSPNSTTVFGGGDNQSESIVNSLSILEDFVAPEQRLLSQMRNYLESIDKNIKAVGIDVIRTGEFALGVGAVNSQEYYKKEPLPSKIAGAWATGVASKALFGKVFGLMNPLVLGGIALDQILDIGIVDTLGNLTNKLLGAFGLGGGGYNWQKLAGSGIQFGEGIRYGTRTTAAGYYGHVTSMQGSTSQTLEDAINNFAGALYQNQAYESMSKSFWGSASYSYRSSTTYRRMDKELQNSLARTFENIRDSIVLGSKMLDEDVLEQLNKQKIDIGKIDLSGLKGDELNEKLSKEFSAQADKFVDAIYGVALDDFQDIGEGLYETLVRVSSGVQLATYYTNKLGKDYKKVNYTDIEDKHGEVAFESLSQSIIKADEAIYGTNNGVVEMIKVMNSSAEELYDMYIAFEDVRGIISLTGQDAANLSSAMLLGAGGIEELQDSANTYFDEYLNLSEQTAGLTKNMTKEFGKLNLNLPYGIKGFKELISSIDTSTASGQELYGRVMLLADGFVKLTNELSTLLYAQRDNALELAQLQRQYQDEQLEFYNEASQSVKDLTNDFSQFSKSIDETISNLLGSSDKQNSQEYLLKEFWVKRAKLDELLAKDGDLTSSEIERFNNTLSELTQLTTSIQDGVVGDNSLMTQNLVDELNNIKSEIDFDNQILQVTVVGGELVVSNAKEINNLVSSLGLTNEQVSNFKAFMKDGSITKDEIDALSLTAEQKDALKNVASNTGDKSNTTIGILSQLSNNLEKYNDSISKSLELDGKLEFDDFKAGGLLSTKDEIAFRQSFKAESADTFKSELDELRNNLSYLSLDTVDATKYLKDLAKLGGSGFENIVEFFNTLGEVPDNIKTILKDIEIEKIINEIFSGDESAYEKLKVFDLTIEQNNLLKDGVLNNLNNFSQKFIDNLELNALNSTSIMKMLENGDFRFLENHKLEGLDDSKKYGFDFIESSPLKSWMMVQNETQYGMLSNYLNELDDTYDRNAIHYFNVFKKALKDAFGESTLNKIKQDIDNFISGTTLSSETYNEFISSLEKKYGYESPMKDVKGIEEYIGGVFSILHENTRDMSRVFVKKYLETFKPAFSNITAKMGSTFSFDPKLMRGIEYNPISWLLMLEGRYYKNELPSYDIGTSYVPKDQIANIHKGEIIIDPKSSEVLRKYGIQTHTPTIDINTRALESKLDDLTSITIQQANEIKRMRKEIEELKEVA